MTDTENRGGIKAFLLGHWETLTHSWLVPAMLRRRTFRAAAAACLAAVLYWGVIASDRYVSEAHIFVQQTDMTAGQITDIGGLLTGSGQGNRSDQLLLRDHLLSVDMLERLDAKLNLRAHYSDWRRDPISQMWFENAAIEWFHRHYLSRVSVDFDDYSGLLIVKAQAYDAKMAHAITATLVEEGERYLNAMAHRLAQEQVKFLEKQVVEVGARMTATRNALLAYQNRSGLPSPQGTAESLAAVITGMQSKIVELQARRGAMLGAYSPQAPSVIEIDQQIRALERQIAAETARLASPAADALNRMLEEYQRLQMEAEFAQDLYKTALVALEKGRIDAIRTLKKVSVLQSPSKPQYPWEPRRAYNILLFVLATLILTAIVHLLAAIVRDHRD